MSDTHQLKRGLKNRHVQLLAIGGAIGTGLFLGSGRAIHFGRSIHYFSPTLLQVLSASSS